MQRLNPSHSLRCRKSRRSIEWWMSCQPHSPTCERCMGFPLRGTVLLTRRSCALRRGRCKFPSPPPRPPVAPKTPFGLRRPPAINTSPLGVHDAFGDGDVDMSSKLWLVFIQRCVACVLMWRAVLSMLQCHHRRSRRSALTATRSCRWPACAALLCHSPV